MVGVAGFEPAASWTRTKRDTKLRHTPIDPNIIMRNVLFVKYRGYFSKPRGIGLSRGDGMSYRIVYGSDKNPVKIKQGGGSRIRMLTALCFLLFCLMVSAVWPQGKSILQEMLLPGEMSASEIAFCVMMDDLRVGESLKDSVTVFCQSVIQNEIQTEN